MKISVITASYNYAAYISETIESVLNQSYKDFEYIIFDDGSNDKSLEIINSYSQKDSRIKVYTHKNNQNKGLIITLKEAISKATGDYIIFVESDDTISSNYIEEKIKAIELNKDAAIVFNAIKPIGDENRIKNYEKHNQKVKKLIYSNSFDYYNLFSVNIIPTFSCVMVKKDIIKSIPFDFNTPSCFDWYLWNTILQKYKTIYINKELTTFRLHTQSFSCKKQKSYVFFGLLQLSEKKYNLKFPYILYEFYTKQVELEKLIRPIFRIIGKSIYKLLYVQKQISVITID